MSLKLHGEMVIAALNCFQASFLQFASIPSFPIWRSKPIFNGLFDYRSGHFISVIHIYIFEIEHLTLGSCFMVESLLLLC